MIYDHIKHLRDARLLDETILAEAGRKVITWAGDLVPRWIAFEDASRDVGYDVFALMTDIDWRRRLVELRCLLLHVEALGTHVPIYGFQPTVQWMQEIQNADVEQLRVKDAEYGSSWKRRGGPGAFFCCCRKWDRLETQIAKVGHDVVVAMRADTRQEGLRDDVGDLRRYLMLFEAEMRARETA